MQGFRRSLAVVVGINQYGAGIPPLRSAVNDATQLAQLLRELHGYEVRLLTDQQASGAALRELLAGLGGELGADDRLLFYFAGHGIALDGEDGPAGYLVPVDARPAQSESFLPMRELHEGLSALPCRHMLLVLDCCFAGAFRWSATRALVTVPPPIYQERFQRFIEDPAWQVLTSAADDEQAADLASRFGERRDDGQHSPFALALIDALQGQADLLVRPRGSPPEGDGVVTATELYCYLRDCVELSQSSGQTPGIWPLSKHDKGEFLFLAPGREPNLPPAPPLSVENNPYRGLAPFDEAHKDLFFGRATLVEALQLIVSHQPLTVVVGTSGSGKSSLVKAGLLPALRDNPDQQWELLPALRPAVYPLESLGRLPLPPGPTLAARVAAWREQRPQDRLLLLVDQFEELVTLCRDDEVRAGFLQQLAEVISQHGEQLRVVATVRSDFEPQFAGSALQPWWSSARFVVPPMSQNELRQVIEGPAAVRVLYFEPPALVERIINEVVQMPGALPLLSFMLSELYLNYLERRAENRALSEADYEQLGGVAGALRTRANQEYERLDPAEQETMRRLMLRMVSLEGGGAARRRVLRSELEYPDPAENQRVALVIRRLSAARLLVEGREEHGEAYVEPAHDALVRGWDRLWEWIRRDYDLLPLQRRLTEAARDWAQAGRGEGFLWDDDPRLGQLEQARGAQAGWLNREESDFVARSSALRRRTRRRTLAIVAGAMAVLAVLAIVALLQRGRAIEGEEAARSAAATAQANEQRAIAAQATVEVESSIARSRELAAQSRSYFDSQLDLALLLGLQSYQTRQTLEARSALQDSLEHSPHLVTYLRGHTNPLTKVVMTADGRYAASGDRAGRLMLWSLDTLKPTQEITLSLEVLSLLFSPDGSRLIAVACSDYDLRNGYCSETTISFLSIPDFKQSEPLVIPDVVESIYLSKDGRRLILFSCGARSIYTICEGAVNIWDLSTMRVTRTIQPIFNEVIQPVSTLSPMAVSPDERMLATLACGVLGESDACVELVVLVDLSGEAQPRAVGVGSSEEQVSLAFSPDGTTIAIGSYRQVLLFNVEREEVIADPLFGHSEYVYQLAYSADSRSLVSSSSDRTIIVWDVAFGEEQGRPLVGHSAAVVSLALSSDGRRLVSGSIDGSLIFWDLTRSSALATQFPLQPDFEVETLAFSRDHATLVLTGYGGNVLVWDVAAQRARQHITVETELIQRGSFSPDGRRFAAIDAQGTIIIWDTATWRSTAQITPGQDDAGFTIAASALAFSPDSARLAYGTTDNRVALWDLAAGQHIGQPLEDPSATVSSLAFSPDGRRLAAASDLFVLLWDTASWKPLSLQREGKFDVVRVLTFTPDGRWLVSGWTDGAIIFWDPATGEMSGSPLLIRETNQRATVDHLAFSPDGSTMASASQRSLTLWDVASRQQLGVPFFGQLGYISALSFDPSGDTLLSAWEDLALLQWSARPQSWEQLVCQRTARSFSAQERALYLRSGDRPACG